jgi:ribosomal-protein-alanine N-acetyltransferase
VVRFSVRDFSEADASAVATWRYEPPYDVYNGEPEMDAVAWPDVWFAVDDSDTSELVAFLELHTVGNEVEIGLGLRPDLTSRGLGCSLVEAVVCFAHQRWKATRFALDVLPWNERAIRTYEKAGFRRAGVYVRRFEGGAKRQFLRMKRSEE